MKFRLLALLPLCALLFAPQSDARTRHHAKPAVAARPVLVELFTAQGCEGCPQADVMLGALAKKKGVMGLTFSVDIWDYTGWADTFAMPEFTERQKAYVKRLKLREVYTPEVVVDGAAEAAGNDSDAVLALIAGAAKSRARGPAVTLDKAADRVAIGAGKTAGASDVWLIRYEPKPAPVKVKSGDNHGKTVTATNVVRELIKLGQWRGKPKHFDLPDAPAEGLKTVVVVQAPRGGSVLGFGRN
jgi:hypothetical protein